MRFSEVLDSVEGQGGVWTATVPADWMQGRSIFGGLQSALALRAMRGLVPADTPLRVLQTTFIAPVAGRVTIEARVLRVGKGTTHAEARLVDNGETMALVVGVFGRGRPSRVELAPQPAPAWGEAHDPFEFPVIAGLSVAFAQHFRMRLMAGPLPFTATKWVPRQTFEVSLHDPSPASETHVVAIGDAIPPVAFAKLSEPAPGSSVTWTLEMLADRFDDLPLTGWTVQAELRAGHNGFTSQPSTIFAPSGRAIALSQQSMVVFG
jgi:acyl-CoA thioesterase